MIEEEGNKVLFQVFCNFATGRALVGQAERLWVVSGEQSDAAKIMLDPKVNTEITDIDIKWLLWIPVESSIWGNSLFLRNMKCLTR